MESTFLTTAPSSCMAPVILCRRMRRMSTVPQLPAGTTHHARESAEMKERCMRGLVSCGAVVAVAVLAAGCGGGSTQSSPATSAAKPPTSTAPPPPAIVAPRS